ncbi:hypothetical protein PIB30_108712, partial [Stylosanthes scabra]|nr:hypothetical protein [Stylosanthes scabra]
TIPEPPTLLYNCYFANIQDDVHLLVHDAMREDRKLGFWVLRSGSSSKQWHLLPLPPSLRNYGVDPDKDAEFGSVRYRTWHSFIWKDKLFLMAVCDPAERKFTIDDMFIFYVYDPQNDPKDDRNCNVALTWSTKGIPSEFDCLFEVKIRALLLDNQDNCIGHQCLDEFSEAIPSFNFPSPVNVNFVDLGKGK